MAGISKAVVYAYQGQMLLRTKDRYKEKRCDAVRIVESTIKILLRRPDLEQLVMSDTDGRKPIM